MRFLGEGVKDFWVEWYLPEPGIVLGQSSLLGGKISLLYLLITPTSTRYGANSHEAKGGGPNVKQSPDGPLAQALNSTWVVLLKKELTLEVTVTAVADSYLAAYAELHPEEHPWLLELPTAALPSLSPEAFASGLELARSTRLRLSPIAPANNAERMTKAILTERLTAQEEMVASGEAARCIATHWGPIYNMRRAVAQQPDLHTEVPAVLRDWRRTLEQSAPPLKHQAVACSKRASEWSDRIESDHPRVAEALAEFARFLSELRTDPNEGVGPDRFKIHARWHLGVELDVTDAYEWAWEELERTEQQLASPSVREAVALLMQDSSDVVVGPERFLAWTQSVWDDARRALRIDIGVPELVDSSEAGAHYTPGKVVMSFRGFTRFPRWASIATLLHEGIPGHHLQETLSRESSVIASTWRQRLLIPAYAEGWATFAEQLVPLDHPGHQTGVKISWIVRLGRAICDIGLHTGQQVPDGDTWSIAAVHDFFVNRLALPEATAVNEVERILGRPAHSSSYALGARVWSRVSDLMKQIQAGAMGIEELQRVGAG